MNTKSNKQGLRTLRYKLEQLLHTANSLEVIKARELVLEKRRPEIEAIKAEISKLESKRPEKKPRWPENTPANVLEACKKYWEGSTESWTFRIHLWNDKAVWTSYPSGGYSDNGGWHRTPVCYELISLIEKSDSGRKAKRLAEIQRRTSPKELLQILNEKTA